MRQKTTTTQTKLMEIFNNDKNVRHKIERKPKN